MKAIALACVVLVMAGCSSGGAAPATPTSQPDTAGAPTTDASGNLSHDEFLRQLSEWCKAKDADLAARFKADYEQAAAAGRYKQAAQILEAHQAVVQGWELRIPIEPGQLADDDEAAFRQYLVLTGRLDGLLVDYDEALKAKAADRVQRVAGRVAKAREDWTQQATDMGLEECGA
jgi:hypothetical protein